MEKIKEFNCDGMCAEVGCNEKYSFFTKQNMCGVLINIAFCKSHADEFEKNKGSQNEPDAKYMKCEKCDEKINKENFWNHPHNEYTTIDWEKHENEQKH